MVTRVDKYLGGLGIDATGKLEVTDNASVVVGNGTSTGNVYAGTINSGGVELRANDYATLLSARSNDYSTYLVALGGLTGSNTNLSDNISIFTGAFTGSNTRLSGAESNVIALQGGISSANTNLSDNVAIFTGAFTGSNTRLSGAESNVASLQGGLSGTNTNLSGNVAIFTGAFTGSNTRLSGAESNVASLQGGLSGTNTAVAAITSSPVTFQSNVTIFGNLNLTGNSTIITANTVSFGDSLLSLASNSTADVLDIGLYGHYSGGGYSNNHTGIIRSVASQDWMFFAAYAKEEPNLTVDIANSTFALANIRVRTANASQDVIAANALISPLVYSGAVELRSNDYATYLMALGGISAANTAILNLQGGLANTNITALTGGLAGANTNIIALTGGLAGANTNITALTGGLAGANTNITALTGGLAGANTNITALIGGLTGANTNISARDTVANVYTTWNYLNSNIILKANTAAPTFTGTVTTSSLTLTAGGGIEGGQLDFANAVTDTTIATGIAIDIYGDKIRFYEKGGTNRGAYLDLSASLTGVGSNLLSSSGGGSGVPVASIIMYGANTAPSGWLVCDGAEVSRSTYAALFAVVSTVFGIGDNTTTFNLPDFRGRSPYGVDASQSITIGASSVDKINASFQNSTGTGTSGSGGPTTHSVTTIAYQQPVLVKDQATNGLVTDVAAHTAHTHTIPALTVSHPAEVVQFIIKT
jgi:microcystin-dependent protein